mmetsp:Transcript_33980/g.59218  ORF Transcript_33980/g.59218 Transcript_33980/m.59218 type:complete len:83 (+) Transcript_33980:2860-3108(+)
MRQISHREAINHHHRRYFEVPPVFTNSVLTRRELVIQENKRRKSAKEDAKLTGFSENSHPQIPVRHSTIIVESVSLHRCEKV